MWDTSRCSARLPSHGGFWVLPTTGWRCSFRGSAAEFPKGRRSTAATARFPAPISPEAGAVPTDHGVRSDNCSAQDIRSQPVQPNKHQPIDPSRNRSLRRLAPQDIELMAKRQDFDFEGSSRSEQSNQPAPDQFPEIEHRGDASPDSLLFASRFRFVTGAATIKNESRGEMETRESCERCHAQEQSA